MCNDAKHCSNTEETLPILIGLVLEEQGDWKKTLWHL